MDLRKAFQSEYSEHYRIRAVAYAEADGEALRLERLSKRVFSQIVTSGEGSIVAREHAARINPKYTSVEDAWVTASTRANVAKADMEAVKIAFEEFRSRSATARVERGM